MAIENLKFARNVAFPLKFESNCDLNQDVDDAVLKQSMQLISMTPVGTIPLFPDFGSTAQYSVFDPMDETAEIELDTSLRVAFEKYEPRVTLDKEFIFDEGNRSKIVIVPYRNNVTGKRASQKVILGQDKVQ